MSHVCYIAHRRCHFQLITLFPPRPQVVVQRDDVADGALWDLSANQSVVELSGLVFREMKKDDATRHMYEVSFKPAQTTKQAAAQPWLLLGSGGAAGVKIGAVKQYARAGAIALAISSVLAVDPLLVIEAALSLVQALPHGRQLVLLTDCIRMPHETRGVRPHHGGLWGLARSVRAEDPSAKITCVDTKVGLCADVVSADSAGAEAELVMRGPSARFLPRLTQFTPSDAPPTVAQEPPIRAMQIVTGGTGGLGLLTARWLAQCGAAGLALASRSQRALSFSPPAVPFSVFSRARSASLVGRSSLQVCGLVGSRYPSPVSSQFRQCVRRPVRQGSQSLAPPPSPISVEGSLLSRAST